jgi:1,2-diacylglycerol 3-beta-galactosyltransferase
MPKTLVYVTDLFGGPTEWFLPGADHYIVPTERMKEAGVRAGLATSQLSVRRLPTASKGTPSRPDSSQRLAILVVGGSEGAGPMEAICLGLARVSADITVVAACGHNERLRRRLTAAASPNLSALAYVPSLVDKYCQFHLIITKPGSLSLMELVDRDVPFLMMAGIPGIESSASRTLAEFQGMRPLASRRHARLVVDRSGRLAPSAQRAVSGLSALSAALPHKYLSLGDLNRLARAQHVVQTPVS